jgi:hypothetical protein
MARLILGTALLAAVVVIEPAPASAWFHSGSASYYYSSYSYYPSYSYYYPVYAYYPAPVVRYYYYPAYFQPAAVCPVPVAGPAYAQPTPAPASQGREPPLNKKGPPPKVDESRSFAPPDDKATTAVEDSRATCRVGFWNVSGRDISLTVNGRTQQIRRDASVTLLVNRDFTWQIDGQAPQKEQVPSDGGNYEVVIR